MNTPAWIVWMGSNFSTEQYLFWTRWQCLAWTLADLFLIFFLLMTTNVARTNLSLRPHKVSFAVWLFTALFLPFIPFASSGRFLFLLELIITVPHFLLLIYILAANIRIYPVFLHSMLGGTRNSAEK